MKIARIIEPLTPLALYLQPRDVRAALQPVRAERPREWADFVIWYLTGQSYGKAHRLEGYGGVIRSMGCVKIWKWVSSINYRSGR